MIGYDLFLCLELGFPLPFFLPGNESPGSSRFTRNGRPLTRRPLKR